MLSYHANIGPTKGISGDCTQLVVYNELGEPVSVIAQLNDELCIASHFGNEDFKQVLELLDINNKDE